MCLATSLRALDMHHKRSWVVLSKPFQKLFALSLVVSSAVVEFLSNRGREGEEGFSFVISFGFGLVLDQLSTHLVACAQKIVEIRFHSLPR